MKIAIAAIIAIMFACAWPTISRADDWPGATPPPATTQAPVAVPSDQVRAVMFEITISRSTGIWTHAQVIGGYPSHEACLRAAMVVEGAIAGQLDPDDIAVVLCPDIKIEGVTKP
jgi:hypothetical protein